jgi:hypothetical protein
MSEEALHPLDQLQTRAEPASLIARHAWLFRTSPEIPLPASVSWQEHEAALWRLRDDAIRQVSERDGLPGLLELAGQAEAPFNVGVAVARNAIGPSAELALLRATVGIDSSSDPRPAYAQFGHGYIAMTYANGGSNWLDRVVSFADSSSQRAAFAMALPLNVEMWDRLDAWDKSAADLYWQRVPIELVSKPETDLVPAVERLVRAGRLFAAVRLVGGHAYRPKPTDKLPIPIPMLIELLQDAVRRDPAKELAAYGPNSNEGRGGVYP